MWRHVHHRLVVGYHGCDRAIAERVLLGRAPLKASDNDYDWLGSGVYFWEHTRRRAIEFARWKQEKGQVDEPAVIGAYIFLGRCFDLTDTDATAQLSGFYEDYRVAQTSLGLPLATNRPARGGDDLLLRRLDCAVLNLGLQNLDSARGGGRPFYQTVRGVFVEGAEAYPGAAIRLQTHVQVAVRDPGCILGYFMPTEYDDLEELT